MEKIIKNLVLLISTDVRLSKKKGLYIKRKNTVGKIIGLCNNLFKYVFFYETKELAKK